MCERKRERKNVCVSVTHFKHLSALFIPLCVPDHERLWKKMTCDEVS